MIRALLTATASVTLLLTASGAEACSALIEGNAITGESLRSATPEWWAREQAGWRAQSDSVFVAQIRAARMVSGDAIEFTLTPVAAVYGDPVPQADLPYRWLPGDTCNPFPLAISDHVVVYARRSEANWEITGLTLPERLQDRPPDFSRRMRLIHRGVLPGPSFDR